MDDIVYAGKHTRTWTVSRHLHKQWELIFCTGGSGELVFDDRTLAYRADDVAVIPPMTPHANISEEGFTNIHVSLMDSALPHTEPSIVHADPNGFLLDAFTAAFYYYSEAAAGRALLPLYGQLIVAFLTSYRPVHRHSESVQRIEDDILQHYPDCDYDLNACLEAMPFQTGYLKRLFKKETGLTPLQYLTDKRLENAARALASICGKGSISETAHLCGFDDPLYFSRLFKKKYGVSPRNYAPDAAAPEPLGPEGTKIMV